MTDDTKDFGDSNFDKKNSAVSSYANNNTELIPFGVSDSINLKVESQSVRKVDFMNINNAVDFILKFFKGNDGFFSYLWCKGSKRKVTIPFGVDNREDIEKAVTRAFELNADNYDIYFGVNVGSKPTNENRRYTDSDIARQVVLVTDIDIATDGHHKDKNLAPDIDTAKSFLPIQPTFLICSGGGIHAYYKWETPITLSNTVDRNIASERGKKLIELIKQNANGYSGIDSVQDLPRILRLPYTYNCKNADNRKPCTVLFDNGDFVTVERIDALINSSHITTAPPDADKPIFYPSNTANNEFTRALAIAALDAIDPAVTAQNGGNDWLAVNSACKNLGLDTEVDDWNKKDPERYDKQQNKRRYDSLNDSSFGLNTLIGIAKKFGFDAAEFRRKWFNARKKHLKEVQKEIAEFESLAETKAETLKNVETFNISSVFNDEIIDAAAYAKLFNRQDYSAFCLAIKNYGDTHRAEKVNLNDFRNVVNDKADLIIQRQNELKSELVRIKGSITTNKFISDNPELQNFTIPDGYVFSDEGVTKIVDDKGTLVQVCNCPIIVARKNKNFEEKTFKLTLKFWTREGKPEILPAMSASSIFNARKIIDLADYGLPVDSSSAFKLTEYLNIFKVKNEKIIPLTYVAPRCGWYKFGDTDVFVDPRRNTHVTDDGQSAPLIVDNSSQFAATLTTHGTIENWKKAYDLAKTSPVARLMVAAAVAPILLKILGERNFLLYIYANTRAGKTSALLLGASAVGSQQMIRSFDATKNGLIGAASDVNDYPFLIDEKQQADSRLVEQFSLITYALTNGIGRTRLDKDSMLKKISDWRTIVIATGETPLISDNATGGAFTRTLQIRAPKIILDSDTCKQIREIIKDNYGHIFPFVIDKIFYYGTDKLRESYEIITDAFAKDNTDILPEYQRYIAVMTLADAILNICLGVDEETAEKDALNNARKIFRITPTTNDIDDTTREINSIKGFIAENQSHFIGGNIDIDKIQKIYGSIEESCIYITVAAMKFACESDKLNYDKVVADLVTAGVIIPSNKMKKGYRNPLKTFQKKLSKTNSDCYKMVFTNTDSDSE